MYICRTEALYQAIHSAFPEQKFDENVISFESIKLIQAFLKSVDYFFHALSSSRHQKCEWPQSIHMDIETSVNMIIGFEEKRRVRETLARTMTAQSNLLELLFSPIIKRPLCMQKPKVPTRNIGDIRDDKYRYQKMITEWIYDFDAGDELLSNIIKEGGQILGRMRRIEFLDTVLHFDSRLSHFIQKPTEGIESCRNVAAANQPCFGRTAEYASQSSPTFTLGQLLNCGKYVSQAYRKFIFSEGIQIPENTAINSKEVDDVVVSICQYLQDVTSGRIAKSVVWKTFGEMNRWEW
jgi:hypothetical protein